MRQGKGEFLLLEGGPEKVGGRLGQDGEGGGDLYQLSISHCIADRVKKDR